MPEHGEWRSPVSAPRSGRGGRRFKSSLPDQLADGIAVRFVVRARRPILLRLTSSLRPNEFRFDALSRGCVPLLSWKR